MIRNAQHSLCAAGLTAALALSSASTPGLADVGARPNAPLKAGSVIRDCPDLCPPRGLISAGEFRMGSPIEEDGRDHQEGPMHKVRIGYSFLVGRYDVTVGEFSAFVKETGYDAGRCDGKADLSWRNPGFPQDDASPVVCVNFADAQAYAAWLSKKTRHTYRLLSEAEYEYVNRAGTRTAFWWGPKVGVNHANCAACGSVWDHNRTSPVGGFPPNRFGLYDTTGNVYAWVSDCWNDIYDNAPVDGAPNRQGDCSMRGLRGGGWGSGVPHIRAAFRLADPSGARYDNMGFRLARSRD
jgi:formylglycine-generating enzyme required for sulfatase activity